MTIQEKLQIIQKLSGLSQENLAHELHVSFATLNSWINNRSQPHQKKLQKINDLFTKYTKLDLGDDQDNLNKKELILAKQTSQYTSNKNILTLINSRPDVRDQFILSATYNTNRLEGSTLTEDETAAVIFRNQTLSNKHLIEHLEAKNHQTSLEFLLKYLEKNRINEELILKLHSILMNGILDNAGLYRNHGVRIVGSNVPTANHIRIPDLMRELVQEINQKTKDIIRQVTQIHSKFEQIHPFSDGNGRIGRLILSAMLILSNLPPVIIQAREKELYLKYLRKSQLKNDFSDLEDLVCDAILNSFRIIN